MNNKAFDLLIKDSIKREKILIAFKWIVLIESAVLILIALTRKRE